MLAQKELFFFTFLFCVFELSVSVQAQKNKCDNIERLLDAIAAVESCNKAEAIGDKGLAIGTYQIHRDYWEDGTRFLGVSWDYQKAFDREKSRKVVKAYLLYYGKDKDLIEMARIHNGGPKGYMKKSTLSYARKIKRIIHQKQQ